MPFRLFSGKKPSNPGDDAAKPGPDFSRRETTSTSRPAASSQDEKYVKPKRVYSKPIEELCAILYRDSGTVMSRITPKAKPVEVCVWFNPKTYIISWTVGSIRGKPGTQIGQSNLEKNKNTILSNVFQS